MTRSLCLLSPLTYFSNFSLHQQQPLVCFLYLWVCFCFVSSYVLLFRFQWNPKYLLFYIWFLFLHIIPSAAAAKSLQSCPTLCDPRDGSPPGSPVPGILQAKHWSGLPFPSPTHESEKWKWSCSVMSDS